ncbi:cysteine desulfuration protein SufE [Sodalis-like secondary symbiont of Drepanosiphum platanoidis]|uniref:cysteine desulfuration protein SufE n=1 Tax=Sodalis-like secondary symbiont of Drepanosiphum platanoidis TaxID=2994493 RepID=UPI003464A33A
MYYLPNKKKLLYNFSRCYNWEEKYIYIIELSKKLSLFPEKFRIKKYLISGCQSQVWIVLTSNKKGIAKFYGDSDASIVKGLIAIIFIIFEGINVKKIIKEDIQYYLKKLNLNKYLTPSRSYGIQSIIETIYMQSIKF